MAWDNTEWGGSSSGPSSGTLSVVEHTANTTLGSADFNKIHRMTAAGATAFTLPAATAGHIGKWYAIKKRGAGNLTITPDGSDTIAGDSSLVNSEATQTYAGVVLIVEAAGLWGIEEPLGDWIGA